MLRFTSLTVENFGPFKGSQTIDFTNDDGVTIIWGNNGRGKTTLLNIFRYAIFGRFKNRRGSNVDLTMLSNRESRLEGRFGFKVVLHMQYDDNQFELTRQYKLRPGIKKPTKNDDYEQSTYLKKGGAILSVADMEHVLKIIMPDQVSRFFLFDGELLQEYEELLIEESDVGTNIKDSIEKILGVPVLTNGATDTETVLDSYRKAKTKTAQSNIQTEQLGSQIAALEAELQVHNFEIERLREELLEEQGKKSGLEVEMDQNEHVKRLIESMNNLESSIEIKKSKRDELLSSICNITKDAWKGLVGERVRIILDDVEKQVKSLEVKENTEKATEHFLEEMKIAVRKKHCHICGQDIDDIIIEKLEEQIKETKGNYGYLTKEEKNKLSSLKLRKATLSSMNYGSSKEKLEIYEHQIDSIKVEISDDERKLKTIKEEIEKHGNIEDLSTTMKVNINDLAQCIKKIDNLKEGERHESNILSDIKGSLLNLNSKLDRTATGNDMLKAMKRVELCEQINQIFDEGINAYRYKLKNQVEKDATDLFLQISNDPDYVKLEINDNYGLSIIHATGETVPLRSAGFEHVVALSLIGALHKNAPLRGPVVMDSPFGRLDPIHKENITKALPSLSEQIILLVYTHEIDEQRARETIGMSLKKEYRLTRQSSFYTRIELNQEVN